MSKPGTNKHEGALPVREGSNRFGPALDLTVDPFDRIVSSDFGPMAAWIAQ